MFVYATEFSWWGFGKVYNSHPTLTLAANIIRTCQDQIGLSQPETLGLSEGACNNALCNMVQGKQKGRWENLETKCLTVTAAVDEDKCARQSSFTNLLRCSMADKQNFYKVRQDRKPFNIMRMNPFSLMKLYTPFFLPMIVYRGKAFKYTQVWA